MRPLTRFLAFFAAITLPLYALDQLSKWAVVNRIDFEGGRVVIPGFFDLVHWHNTGAAFSMLANSNGLFIGISVVALIVLSTMAWRNALPGAVGQVAWSLLLAGILGNLTDRLVHGYVVDFLLFDLHVWPAHPWPAFNVADSCICVATVLFLWESLRSSPRQ
jgi:signal peptidase II